MCGITGFGGDWGNADELTATALRMADTLIHRGPDDHGVWTQATAGLGLAHRRLAVLDLSPHGHQPMLSMCGRWVLVFNGEIYNAQLLRTELTQLGHNAWRGHSDTEIMLAALAHWGLVATLPRLIGMFACAVWDRQQQSLSLFCDRVGEKPLYYGWAGNVFVFGSELKALRAHPQFHGVIDRNALNLFMRYGYIPAPHSIYTNVYKLRPGTVLTVTAPWQQQNMVAQTYWSAQQIATQGTRHQFRGTEQEAQMELETLLTTAIKGQMAADVPLGAFLSGGIDSSTIVALMQMQSTQPVRTFSIGFWEQEFDEAPVARAVARHLGTEHTEVYVEPKQALAVIPRLATIYDEPFADSSQIPTALLAAVARQHVTVSLSGDGGDELFCGYNRYIWARSLWQGLNWMPQPLRRGLAAGCTHFTPQQWDRGFHSIQRLLPSTLAYANFGDKLHKLARLLLAHDGTELYQNLVIFWPDSASLVLGSANSAFTPDQSKLLIELPSFTQQMMYLDLITYLPDDILVKVDRAAMAVSLESRVPFLDHRVIEFAWSLPLTMLLRRHTGKWLLRQILYRYVPEKLVNRPKMGFGVPLAAWLRGPLRDWAEDLLNAQALQQDGWLNPEIVRNKWQEHLQGRRNWAYHLWNVLIFQAWLANK